MTALGDEIHLHNKQPYKVCCILEYVHIAYTYSKIDMLTFSNCKFNVFFSYLCSIFLTWRFMRYLWSFTYMSVYFLCPHRVFKLNPCQIHIPPSLALLNSLPVLIYTLKKQVQCKVLYCTMHWILGYQFNICNIFDKQYIFQKIALIFKKRKIKINNIHCLDERSTWLKDVNTFLSFQNSSF